METTNVVEISEKGNIEIKAFESTPEGIKKAEELFKEVVKEQIKKETGEEANEKDLEMFLDDGRFAVGGYSEYELLLVHSN